MWFFLFQQYSKNKKIKKENYEISREKKKKVTQRLCSHHVGATECKHFPCVTCMAAYAFQWAALHAKEVPERPGCGASDKGQRVSVRFRKVHKFEHSLTSLTT